MKRLIILILCCAACLSGCSHDVYKQLYAAKENVALSKAETKQKKYEAIAAIANSGDPTLKAMGMAILLADGIGNNDTAETWAAPPTIEDSLLRWASIIVPSAVNAYGMYQSARVSMNASDNQRETAVSTNSAFVGMGSLIQAAPITTTTTTTTTDSHAASSSYNTTSAPAVPQ